MRATVPARYRGSLTANSPTISQIGSVVVDVLGEQMLPGSISVTAAIVRLCQLGDHNRARRLCPNPWRG
jgi:hypothetical protein